MTSKVDIVNIGLSAIGTRSTIADFQEASKEASQARLQYDQALGCVLQAAHWNFARGQVVLTLLQDATATPPGPVPQPWLYEYAYPADCVQARYLMPTIASAPGTVAGSASLPAFTGQPVRFLISADKDASGNDIKVILCNMPQAQLVYTRRITNTDLFDDTFTYALGAYLGSRMCMALTGDRARMKDAFAIADNVTREARASNGNEGLTVQDTMPDWIAVRGVVSDWASPPGSIYWQAPQNLVMIS